MKTISQKKKESKEKFYSGKILVRGLLLFLLILSFICYRDSLWNIWEGIRQVTKKELSISVFLAVAGYLLEGMTIACMMGIAIPHAAARNGIWIAFVCEFYRLTTLGSGSGFAEIHYMTQKKIEPGKAATLTMIQYVIKRIAIMLFGIAGFICLFCKEKTQSLCSEYKVFMGIGCLITIIVIALILCLALSAKLTKAALKLMDWFCLKMPSKEKVFCNWKEQITLLNRSGKSILSQRKKMICLLLLQTGKLVLFYSIPAYFFYGKTDLLLSECIFLMAVSFMLAGVIPTPSGAVSLEFVFLLFFTSFMSYTKAVPAILLFRFATWICPALIGGILLVGKNLAGKNLRIKKSNF